MTVSARNISGRDLVVPLSDGSTVLVHAGNSYGFPDAVGNGLLLQTSTWQPGGAATPVSLVVQPNGNTSITVKVTGQVSLFTDVGLSVPATFPATITTNTTYYASVYGLQTLTVSLKDSLGYEHYLSGTAVLDPANPTTTISASAPLGSGTYAPLNVPTTSQAGASYTLVLADGNSVVEFTNAAAVTATVPPSSSVAWVVGMVINVYAAGAGGVTVAAGAGVTIRNNSAALVQYGECSLRYRGSDIWVRVG